MSFGGGREQYTLEYLVKVTNQGASAGAFTQVSNGIKQVDMATKQATVSQNQLYAAQNKVQQAQMGVSKALKGMAFGFIGIATAGAEALGMLSMWQSTQEGVKQAQADVNAALKDGGKDSKEYKDAVQELTKAQRWQRMTMRNLVLSFFDLVPFILLSINGMVKQKRAAQELGTAQKELKAIQDALGVSNTKLAVSNEAANASQLSIVKGSKSLATAEKAAAGAVIPLTGALSGMSVAAVSSETKVSKLSAAGAKLKGSFASVALGISSLTKKLLPIAAIIGTIIIAVEAWKNNWGGFGDMINKAGVAIGNIHPALKGLMEGLAKVGLTIDALIHGDFGKIKEIWTGAAQGVDAFGASSDAALKKAEEFAKAVDDLRQAGNELIMDAANAKKGDRKDILESWGIKGGARSRFNKTLDDIKQFAKKWTGITDSLKAQNQLQDWGKVFDIPQSVFKKSAFTIASRFKWMADHAKDDFKFNFNDLANIVKADAKKGGKTVSQDIAKYLVDHPAFLEQMRKLGLIDPETETLIQQKIKEARAKIDKIIADANNMKDTPRSEIGSSVDKQLNSRGLNVGEGPTTQGGMFAGIINQIKALPATIQSIVSGTDFVSLGKNVRIALLNIFNINNAQNLGQFLRNNVLNPIIGALQGVFGKWIADLQADPIKTLLGTANAIGAPIAAFVAGLFGFQDEAAMDKAMLEGMQMFSAKVIHAVDNFVNNTPWLWDLLHGDIIGMFIEVGNAMGSTASKNIQQSQIPDPDMSNVIDPTITGIINKSWLRVEFWLQKNQWLTELFTGDPIPMIIEFMKNNSKQGKTATVVTGIPVPKVDVKGIIDKYVTGPITTFFNGIGNDDNVKAIVSFFKDPIGSIIALAKFIKSQVIKTPPPPTFTFEDLKKKLGIDTLETVASQIKTELETNPIITAVRDFFTGKWDPLKGLWSEHVASGASDQKSAGIKITIAGLDLSQIETDAGTMSKKWSDTMAQMRTGASGLSTHWNDMMNNIVSAASNGAGQIANSFSSMVTNSGKVMSKLSSHWNDMASNMAGAGDTSAGDIYSSFSSMVTHAGKAFSNLSSHFSDMMSNMENAASSAADNIQSSLDSIKAPSLTVSVGLSGAGAKFIKNAKGYHGMVNEPTLMLAGEAGPERVDITPMKDVSKRTSDGGGFGGSFNQQITLKISGSDIINERNLTKRIRTDVGKNRDRFG